MNKPRIFLIDSYALAFRMFYAFMRNPLHNSKGVPTSMVFGYWNAVLRLIQDQNPTHLAIVQDMGAATFRHELYSEYKSNRSEMPEEMKQQLPYLENALKICGIPVLGIKGYEADDLMATLAWRFAQEQAEVFLVTKDKDMMQIVNDHICLISPGTGSKPTEITKAPEVLQKFGVPPEQMRDLLALMGDASDNVPGVPKVGPKTAADLLQKYQTIDAIYENIEQITRKALKQTLVENKESAYLSQKLVTLAEVPQLETDLRDLQYCGLNTQALSEMFTELELHSLLRQLSALPQYDHAPVEQEHIAYSMIEKVEDFAHLLDGIPQNAFVALDTETDSLQALDARMVGLCLSWQKEQGFYVPIKHASSKNVCLQDIKGSLQGLLQRTDITLVMHNAKYDLQILENEGFVVTAPYVDTMLASYLLNPGVREHSLDRQVQKRLGHSMIPIESLIGKGAGQKTFDTITAQQAYRYGAEDAVYTLRLWDVLEQELRKENLYELFLTMEVPLAEIIRVMEKQGVYLHVEQLAALGVELEKEIHTLEERIYMHAEGQPFNINSPKQLAQVLFEDLKLPHSKKTKSGYSTDAAVLEELRDVHPIVANLLEYRELVKLLGTYVKPLPELIHAKTGRLHTSFSQVVTATGRLSGLNPNLQNIPIRSVYGKRIRAAFGVANPEQTVLIAADYSQIELRVLAHLSKDAGLLEAYRMGQDIHAQTASAIFNTMPGLVTEDMRRQAKAVNFGVIYGMSAFRLARDFGISRKQAQTFIDTYFDYYSGIKTYIDTVVQQATQNGYAQTLFGRKRYLPDLHSTNQTIRSHAERTAVNAPIQGTAADIIKLAMIQIHTKIIQEKLPLQLLLQVHDELVFEAPVSQAKELCQIVKQTMEQAVKLDVPLDVSVAYAKNWLEAH
jgi:DNA polymerase I